MCYDAELAESTGMIIIVKGIWVACVLQLDRNTMNSIPKPSTSIKHDLGATPLRYLTARPLLTHL